MCATSERECRPVVGPAQSDSHAGSKHGGHLLEDTPAKRDLIQSAIDQANLRSADVLKDVVGTLEKYYKTLPDGTQAWAEVRDGEITGGGINVIPR